MKFNYKIVPLLLGAMIYGNAFAVEYNKVQNNKSSIEFSYQQMGVGMNGKFNRFSSQINFDPAKPNLTKASFDIELASIDTGSAEADSEVVGKSWFNAKLFPTAKFVATNVSLTSENRYDVVGKLTIKGQSKDLKIPMSFSKNGNFGFLEGSFTIRRGDFKVGEGDWAKFDLVANDVQVRFKIAINGK
jgi:polyisoprenoid-binding protein YceI